MTAQGFMMCPPPVLASPHSHSSCSVFTIYICAPVTLGHSGLIKLCQADAVSIHCKAYPQSTRSKHSIHLLGIQFETIFHPSQYNHSNISLLRNVLCTYNFSAGRKQFQVGTDSMWQTGVAKPTRGPWSITIVAELPFPSSSVSQKFPVWKLVWNFTVLYYHLGRLLLVRARLLHLGPG